MIRTKFLPELALINHAKKIQTYTQTHIHTHGHGNIMTKLAIWCIS